MYPPVGLREKCWTASENCAQQVDNPADGNAWDNPQHTNDKHYDAVGVSTLYDAVNCPNDVEGGDAKQQFDNPWEVVHFFDEVFHFILFSFLGN
jgi:hypothetical protein